MSFSHLPNELDFYLSLVSRTVRSMVFNTIAVLVHTLLLVETVLAVTYLTFNKNDCNEYRHYLYNENDEYLVQWNGEAYPKYCSLRFKTMTGMDTYRLCASVEQFNLDCSITLKFYWGVEMDIKKYDCNRDITQNPIQYCNDDVVYMNLEPDYYGIRSTSSSLRIRVKATLIKKYGQDDVSTGSMMGTIIGTVVGVIFLIIILVIVCRICRNNQGSSFGGGTVRYPTADVQRQGEGVHVSLMNQQGQYNPPGGQYQAPGGQYYPPGGQYQPSGGQYQPSGGQYQPSGGQYQPSAGPNVPHTGQYYPPQPSAPPGQHSSIPSAPPGQYNAPPPSYKDCIE